MGGGGGGGGGGGECSYGPTVVGTSCCLVPSKFGKVKKNSILHPLHINSKNTIHVKSGC